MFLDGWTAKASPSVTLVPVQSETEVGADVARVDQREVRVTAVRIVRVGELWSAIG